MCYPVKCKRCHKTTWAGCGLHIQMVMSRVPVEERCTCGEEWAIKLEAEEAKKEAKEHEVVSSVLHMTTKSQLISQVHKAAQDGKIVVIDFWTTGCAPCKMMAPIFERMAKNHVGKKAVFLKVNGEECEDCVSTVGIAAFPTFQLWRDGDCVDEVVGVNESGLEEMIRKHLPQ